MRFPSKRISDFYMPDRWWISPRIIHSVSREFLICFLSEFNLIDNLAQKDSEQEDGKQERYDVKNYQFEPSWVEIAFDKVTVGYVGIYVNADFSLIFEKDNDEWNLIGK